MESVKKHDFLANATLSHPYRVTLNIITGYIVLIVIALIQPPLGLLALASHSVNVFLLSNMLMTVFSENYFF